MTVVNEGRPEPDAPGGGWDAEPGYTEISVCYRVLKGNRASWMWRDSSGRTAHGDVSNETWRSVALKGIVNALEEHPDARLRIWLGRAALAAAKEVLELDEADQFSPLQREFREAYEGFDPRPELSLAESDGRNAAPPSAVAENYLDMWNSLQKMIEEHSGSEPSHSRSDRIQDPLPADMSDVTIIFVYSKYYAKKDNPRHAMGWAWADRVSCQCGGAQYASERNKVGTFNGILMALRAHVNDPRILIAADGKVIASLVSCRDGGNPWPSVAPIADAIMKEAKRHEEVCFRGLDENVPVETMLTATLYGERAYQRYWNNEAGDEARGLAPETVEAMEPLGMPDSLEIAGPEKVPDVPADIMEILSGRDRRSIVGFAYRIFPMPPRDDQRWLRDIALRIEDEFCRAERGPLMQRQPEQSDGDR